MEAQELRISRLEKRAAESTLQLETLARSLRAVATRTKLVTTITLEDVYPVGIVVMTIDNTNPATTWDFPGTWEPV